MKVMRLKFPDLVMSDNTKRKKKKKIINVVALILWE